MVRIKLVYEQDLRVQAIHQGNGAMIQTDAPKEARGNGELFSPTDLLATSLGTCVLTLMGIAAQRLKIDLGSLRATVDKEMIQSPCKRVGRIVVHIYSSQKLDERTTLEMEQIAVECPVHHSLHPDIQQEFIFHWGEA